jgi:hypothetical protein
MGIARMGTMAIAAGSLSLAFCWIDAFPAGAAPGVAEAATSEFDRHVVDLRRRLPSRDFSIVEARPFAVVGDEPARVVQQRARQTVGWAVRMLKQDYFAKDPTHTIDIWLFKDAESYERHVLAMTGSAPTTPYGFYSSRHKALMMNIETGGGTLVHEIVHPFVEANFPECPPWFNEGLASLYEQSTEAGGHIRGLVNWRLPGLQQAIKAKTVPEFDALTAMNENAFYGDGSGTYYAQARYLCYYLQEQGKLVDFYREFSTNRKTDPTGAKSLRKVLGTDDLKAFRQRWERFVLGLAFPVETGYVEEVRAS